VATIWKKTRRPPVFALSATKPDSQILRIRPPEHSEGALYSPNVTNVVRPL